MSIYEVTQMLQDKNNIQNDMREAVNLVKDMFYKKYLEKIQTEVKDRQEKIKLSRPKEVELIYAMKPFVAHDKSIMLDKLADSIMMMKTINALKSDIKIDYKSESLHPDGVYDIDENCIASKNNNFINAVLMLVMCNMI